MISSDSRARPENARTLTCYKVSLLLVIAVIIGSLIIWSFYWLGDKRFKQAYTGIYNLRRIEDISEALRIEPDVFTDPVAAAWAAQLHKTGSEPLPENTIVYRYSYLGFPHRHIIVFVNTVNSNVTGTTWIRM